MIHATSLRDHVAARYPGGRCPCCDRPMMAPVNTHRRKPPRTTRTVGHLGPAAGVLASDVFPRSWWYWQCWECNNHQAHRTVVVWQRKLAHDADPRAARVAALATVVEAWLNENGRSFYRAKASALVDVAETKIAELVRAQQGRRVCPEE